MNERFVYENDKVKDTLTGEYYSDNLVSVLNSFDQEIKSLRNQLNDCEIKKANIKEAFLHTEAVIEQRKIQTIIYSMIIKLIDEKIDILRNTQLEHYSFSREDDNTIALTMIQDKIDLLMELKEELPK